MNINTRANYFRLWSKGPEAIEGLGQRTRNLTIVLARNTLLMRAEKSWKSSLPQYSSSRRHSATPTVTGNGTPDLAKASQMANPQGRNPQRPERPTRLQGSRRQRNQRAKEAEFLTAQATEPPPSGPIFIYSGSGAK